MLSRIGKVSGKLLGFGRDVVRRGTTATGTVVEEGLRSARASLYMTSHFIEGGLLPALNFASEMGRDIETSWLDAVSGKKPLAQHVEEMAERTLSASKYERLVQSFGSELFGSARFEGEEVLSQNDVYRLVYLPPKPGVPRQEAALFQVGGFIPYGDRIFRFLPEANLYDRWLERGVPVYVMEVKGDRHQLGDFGALTLDRFIDQTDELAGVAFVHNGQRKMIAGGYCGTGLQLLAYLAGRPRDADAKFETATIFVSPVDGRKCQIMAEMVSNLPRSMMATQLARSQLLGGYLNGVEMWAGLDMSLKAIFIKTSLGRFASGWKNRAWAAVHEVKDLAPQQRFELAGAYWISVPNADRFPIPIDLVRLAIASYDRGIGPDGDLHLRYRGQPLNLKAIAEGSSLKLTGIYGGQDKIVQEDTGHVLKQIFGDRYAHHVNPTAAHVSYICVPIQWRPGLPTSFLPNPIDEVLAQYASKQPGRLAKRQAHA